MSAPRNTTRTHRPRPRAAGNRLWIALFPALLTASREEWHERSRPSRRDHHAPLGRAAGAVPRLRRGEGAPTATAADATLFNLTPLSRSLSADHARKSNFDEIRWCCRDTRLRVVTQAAPRASTHEVGVALDPDRPRNPSKITLNPTPLLIPKNGTRFATSSLFLSWVSVYPPSHRTTIFDLRPNRPFLGRTSDVDIDLTEVSSSGLGVYSATFLSIARIIRIRPRLQR